MLLNCSKVLCHNMELLLPEQYNLHLFLYHNIPLRYNALFHSEPPHKNKQVRLPQNPAVQYTAPQSGRTLPPVPLIFLFPFLFPPVDNPSALIFQYFYFEYKLRHKFWIYTLYKHLLKHHNLPALPLFHPL